MIRKLLLLLLVGAAVATAVLATRARRLGRRVESFAVEVGADPESAPELGDDETFAKGRFAVVRGVHGDDAALGRAMDEAVRQGAELVVVLGDVLADGSDAEARRLAAACRERGVEAMFVPGPRDLASRDVFQRWLGPLRWWFVRRGVLYVGAAGQGGDDDAFISKAAAEAPEAKRRFAFTTGGLGVAWPEADLVRSGDASSVETRSFDEQGGAVVATPIAGGPSAASLWRRFALDVAYPVVRPWAGHVVVLAVCALVAALGVNGLLARRQLQR